MHEALYRLNEFHHLAMPDYFKSAIDVAASKDLSKYICNKDAFAFIAVKEEERIGFTVGSIQMLKSPISKTKKIGSIDEIFIEDNHRGGGVGKKFLTAIEKYCKMNGATDLFTEVWGFNQSALSFYKMMGLSPHVHWLRKQR